MNYDVGRTDHDTRHQDHPTPTLTAALTLVRLGVGAARVFRRPAVSFFA
ncbi:MAG: hypothetical protein NTX68_05270 [Rhodococcus sp.]|nr:MULTISPECIES: hypothetical protein [unclassified Rhodococcus (in: high G+C Gram-positive bacteria)]MCX6490383.1 hypothetical protein [Rhodococcus sp. (in: high G+C Gram-positive bacteria)]